MSQKYQSIPRGKSRQDPADDVTTGDKVKVYIYGFLLCAAIEGVELFALYFQPLAAVGVCFFLLFLMSAVFVTCTFWRHKKRRLFFVSGLLLAAAMGLVAGLWGGSELKQFWQYHEANGQEHASPSAKPSMFEQKTVFHFVDRAYVNTKLTGVVYRTGKLTYCVAPILGKDPVPQPAVLYWAVSTNCCAGTIKEDVVENCHHWGDRDLTGEATTIDNDFYKLAVAKTADWHNFAAQPDSVFVVLMTRAEQQARQHTRSVAAMLILMCAPVLWPLLALVVKFIRGLVVVMCGVKPIKSIEA